ncbi:maleylpyruvate isomerase N-terminal domain-containing protein [Actinophytocola sp.]|uniref:maleylpyruvate isomerase N-terminal domain-containing protein n=1 Tax=Actinophytocola sp. TaxID=1872138 RepID=UPI003D6C1997
MDFASQLEHVQRQAGALRAAAVSAGPDAAVPTCPEWTVQRLVRHIARVHNWVVLALRAEPGAETVRAERPPEDWDSLLPWWDDALRTMLAELRTMGPDAPAWVFDARAASTAGFWARRQAHETAIHRLDAEHAAAGSAAASAVPSLVFEPDLAADGIDELLTLVIPRRLDRERPEAEGTILFHAADAGRAWLVQLKHGEVPEVGPAGDTDADASVVGTADAVYRAAWHRPSTAIVTGDRALVEALRTP